jgi:hypothetical protein
MNLKTEKKLFEAAGVRSVSEISNFPYRTHFEFVSAVRSKKAAIGIEYPAAREFAALTKSAFAYNLILAIFWTPFILMFLSVVLAFYIKSWLTLIGIVTAIVGNLFASPYNQARKIGFLFTILAFAIVIINRSLITPIGWACFAFASTFTIIRMMNRTAWNWAYDAILKSEAFTAYFFKSGNLHIKKND